jgi:membrane fusion protein, copper/silver efflux system
MNGSLGYLRLLPALILLAVAAGGCAKPGGVSPVAKGDVEYWTCTMHPSVHAKTPGKCPICGMELVPVYKNKGVGSPEGETAVPAPENLATAPFSVPVERQQQIGVTYAQAVERPLRFELRAVGALEADPAKAFSYVARTDGYVESLGVTSPGQAVAPGQVLVTLYSPEIRATEQEVANLLRDGGRNAALIASARERLRLWNVAPEDLDALARGGPVSDRLALRSPFAGVVDRVAAKVGMGVKTGDELVSVVDLSGLWLWVEFYENEAGLLSNGQAAEVTLPSLPREAFRGALAAIDPKVDPVKRTVRVRVDLPNPGRRLLPGMYANAVVHVDAGRGLAVPASAVLPTGSGMLAFVDKGQGKLEPRFIEVGRQFTDLEDPRRDRYYEVVSGLHAGERVVASANFLIDAESQVQGALKNWATDEPAPAASPSASATPVDPGFQGHAQERYRAVLTDYAALQQPLARDSTEGLAAAAERLEADLRTIHERLLDRAPDPTALDEALDAAFTEAQTFRPAGLEEARVRFGRLSQRLIALFEASRPWLPPGAWQVVECPKWKKSPARWVQAGTDLANPFLGQKMIGCGRLQAPLQEAR